MVPILTTAGHQEHAQGSVEPNGSGMRSQKRRSLGLGALLREPCLSSNILSGLVLFDLFGSK